MNKSSIERGLFSSMKYKTFKDNERQNQASLELETFCKPVKYNPNGTLRTAGTKSASYNLLDENGIVRANISFGLGITSLKERVNWRLNNNSYYISDEKKISTISLIINPKIEFPFKKFFGLTISPMIQINKYRTYFGIGIGQMIGLVR